MTDPAIEAAQRALGELISNTAFPDRWERMSIAAAREALNPVREVITEFEGLLNPWDDVGFEILDALRPLVYPSEELER